ncbi:glycosyltransferase family 4 protein [Corynebacterium confusum]
MKIVILSQYWAPDNGIPQRRWEWLCGLLKEQGHEIIVITPFSIQDRRMTWAQWLKRLASGHSLIKVDSLDEQTSILRTPFLPVGRSLTQRALNQGALALGMLLAAGYMRKKLRDVDLVIGTVPALPTAAVAAGVSRILGVPYAIDLRDAWPDLLSEWTTWNKGAGERSWREWILSKGPAQVVVLVVRVIMDFVLRRADGILTTSEWLLNDLVNTRAVKSEVPRVTIRNVFPGKTEVRSEAPPRHSKADGLHVLYAGTIGRAQKLENALKAVYILSKKGIKVELRIVGDGASRTSLERLAKEYELDIDFVAKAPADMLSSHYEWADTALVHLTAWDSLKKAIPSKTFELMENGIHITGVVSGETAEIIEKNSAGNVVPPDAPEELAQLWQDLLDTPEEFQISNDGKKWVERERLKVVPSKLQKFLSELG